MNDKKNRAGRISAADIVHCGMFASLMAVGAFIKIMIPIGIWEVTFSYLMKPTFGFLIGFAAAAYVAGKIAEIMPGSGYFKLLFAAFWGEMAYYLCGLVYYYFMFNFVVSKDVGIGFVELISVWFLSTVIPDFILCVLAAGAALRLRPVILKESLSKGPLG